MIENTSIVLVLVGLTFLVAAIRPTYVVCRASENKGWFLLLTLIVSFVVGYAGYLYVLLSRPVSIVELGIAVILGGGGAFVIVIIRLSLQSIEHSQRQADLRFHEARHDALTGLPNRLHFMEKLGKNIADASLGNTRFAVLMLDLDRFKEINDTLGHAVGDELLKKLAGRLQQLSQHYNVISRLGGDEFALILADADEAIALAAAKQLIKVVENSFNIDNHMLVIDMSIGISLFPKDGVDQEKLLMRADIAMYLAKQSKQHYLLYDEAQDTLSPQRLGLISRVKEALALEEFELFYQPVFSVNGYKLNGFEALIRWPQADGSCILPGEFIPQIEQSRYIGAVSRWVIRRSIQQLQCWSASGLNLSMSMNLSAVDLQDEEIVTYIKSTIEEFAVPAARLCFEITESAIMLDRMRAKNIVNGIVELGAPIAMDDFGTGFSSLSLLREFPAQIIKIDRSFVLEIAASSEDCAIVRSMVALGHSLGRKVIAEGVENRASLAMLREIDCDFFQGFYLAKPMSDVQASKWLEQYAQKDKVTM